jgi:hypothetical protein
MALDRSRVVMAGAQLRYLLAGIPLYPAPGKLGWPRSDSSVPTTTSRSGEQRDDRRGG